MCNVAVRVLSAEPFGPVVNCLRDSGRIIGDPEVIVSTISPEERPPGLAVSEPTHSFVHHHRERKSETGWRRRLDSNSRLSFTRNSRFIGGKMSIFPAIHDQERKKQHQICSLVKVPCVNLDQDRSSTGLRNQRYLAPLQTALVTALLRTDPDDRDGLTLRTTVSLHGFPTVRL